VTPSTLPQCSTIKDNALPCLAGIWVLCLAKIFTLQSLLHQHQSLLHFLLLPLSQNTITQLHPFIQMPSVAVSTPAAPYTTFSNSSCFTPPSPSQFHPRASYFCQLSSKPVILEEQPTPKPPHPTSQSRLPKFYSYKLFG
jgi:hypothetical protein